jgi:hypothetical protein
MQVRMNATASRVEAVWPSSRVEVGAGVGLLLVFSPSDPSRRVSSVSLDCSEKKEMEEEDDDSTGSEPMVPGTDENGDEDEAEADEGRDSDESLETPSSGGGAGP